MIYFRITFQYSENTYCTNIAHAESIQDVKKHYSNYKVLKIVEANQSDIDEAARKGMPIIEIETTDKTMSKIDKMERNLQRYINDFGCSFRLKYPRFIAKFDSFQDLKEHINRYKVNDFTIEVIKEYVVVYVINSKLFVGMNR